MSRERFTAKTTAKVLVKFKLDKGMTFPNDDYESFEDLEDAIFEVFRDCSEGDIDDMELVETDFDEEEIKADEVYFFKITAWVSVSGDCYYDPGCSYGPPEYCYEPDIDDLEIDEDSGFCGISAAEAAKMFPGLHIISVEVDQDDYDLDDLNLQPDW